MTLKTLGLAVLLLTTTSCEAATHISTFVAQPPYHMYGIATSTPQGITPDQIKSLYTLPASGGLGTIAIVSAYHAVSIEKDLAAFSTAFHLPACTTQNGCFTEHLMKAGEVTNNHWALETALDVEWAHAIAPTAKIVLVEAATASGTNLMSAVDYAGKLPNVRSVSMSWGGPEFPDEVKLDSHFTVPGVQFFASSGDHGNGVSWPAVSPSVVGVGGTSLRMSTSTHALIQELAWAGSGGGISSYEKAPLYQKTYSIPKSKGMRAVPDVAYDADPISGFSVVHGGVWHVVGGTSAGAPQWAAVAALGSGVSLVQLYKDKSTVVNRAYFRDIRSGSNGACGYYCDARARYDYVTGLGVPATSHF
jgi:subtilase family serine protease